MILMGSKSRPGGPGSEPVCSSEPSVQADSRPTLQSAGSRRSGSGCVAAFIGPLGSLQSIILPLHPRFYRGVAPSVPLQPPAENPAAGPRQGHWSPIESPGNQAAELVRVGVWRLASRAGLLQMSAGSAEPGMLL